MISLLNKIKCIFWLCGTVKAKIKDDIESPYKVEPDSKVVKSHRRWFNNGKEERMFFEDIALQMGKEWKKGRLPKTPKTPKTPKNKKEK